MVDLGLHFVEYGWSTFEEGPAGAEIVKKQERCHLGWPGTGRCLQYWYICWVHFSFA